jgi:hypothetical protein
LGLGNNETIALLDQVKYLFLREISEPAENSLHIVVEEGMVLDPSATVPAGVSATACCDVLGEDA